MKKQRFTSAQEQKFKEYFWIKDTPWKWDRIYLEKTQKYIPYISWIPGIMMVGVWNSLSMNAGSKDSDIDLYIVTKNNAMWSVRILVTLIFQILWVRKTPSQHAGRFCLSFFSTLKWMDFSRFALTHDPYLFFWVLYFQPIYNSHQTYEKFLEVNNSWCNLEDFTQISPPLAPLVSPSLTRRGLGGDLNSLLKNIFLPKTKKSFQKLWKPFWVIIDDNILKFHDHDIRKKIAKNIF